MDAVMENGHITIDVSRTDAESLQRALAASPRLGQVFSEPAKPGTTTSFTVEDSWNLVQSDRTSETGDSRVTADSEYTLASSDSLESDHEDPEPSESSISASFGSEEVHFDTESEHIHSSSATECQVTSDSDGQEGSIFMADDNKFLHLPKREG